MKYLLLVLFSFPGFTTGLQWAILQRFTTSVSFLFQSNKRDQECGVPVYRRNPGRQRIMDYYCGVFQLR